MSPVCHQYVTGMPPVCHRYATQRMVFSISRRVSGSPVPISGYDRGTLSSCHQIESFQTKLSFPSQSPSVPITILSQSSRPPMCSQSDMSASTFRMIVACTPAHSRVIPLLILSSSATGLTSPAPTRPY